MTGYHLIRVGALGHVGHFNSADSVRYPRQTRVVVRTGRGVELGDVLSPPEGHPGGPTTDGTILRQMTVEDQLLEQRLEANRAEAYESCVALLAERGLNDTLMDVEQLFDGQHLYFYFLGDVAPELEAWTSALAEAYEAKVQLRKFTELVSEGCGPGCGTDSATGGGCGGCDSGCALSGACGRGTR